MIKYFIGGIYMKTYQIFFLMLLLVCTGLFAQNVSLEQAVQSSAQTIESRLPQGSKAAVLAFTADSQKFSDYIIDELAIAIGNNNKVMVIDRQYTDVIRKELNIQMSGDVSDDDVKRVGIQLGAQFVITGSLVDIGNAYRFRVIAINVETAVRVAANPVNISINDPQVVFLLTGQRVVQEESNPSQTHSESNPRKEEKSYYGVWARTDGSSIITVTATSFNFQVNDGRYSRITSNISFTPVINYKQYSLEYPKGFLINGNWEINGLDYSKGIVLLLHTDGRSMLVGEPGSSAEFSPSFVYPKDQALFKQ
jgi:TolB-like protein